MPGYRSGLLLVTTKYKKQVIALAAHRLYSPSYSSYVNTKLYFEMRTVSMTLRGTVFFTICLPALPYSTTTMSLVGITIRLVKGLQTDSKTV
jgi:hypothetical protein